MPDKRWTARPGHLRCFVGTDNLNIVRADGYYPWVCKIGPLVTGGHTPHKAAREMRKRGVKVPPIPPQAAATATRNGGLPETA